MRVVIAAPAVRAAMGYHLCCMLSHMQEPVARLFVPEQFQCEGYTGRIVRYALPKTSARKGFAYCNPVWIRQRFREIVAMRPDLLHLFNSEGYPSSYWWIRWARTQLGIPTVVSVHDPIPHPGNLLAATLHRWGQKTIRSSSHVHIFSECFRLLCTQWGFSPERTFVVPLCTDVSNFTQYRFPEVTRENLALFFGRLEAYKGIPVLLDAAQYVRGKLRVAIAGPGKLPQPVERRILAEPDLFELHNRFLHESEVSRLFHRAAVCVMPYVQATQSSVPWIAAGFGVPVVATATGGLAAQVQQINGVLVPPNDPKALAEGMLHAVGRSVIFPEEWNPYLIAQQYIQMYRQILCVQEGSL
ncbi:glycosyltransferase family 4 protein [Fischerella thermalis]|uniref:Glycosyltransferase n=1 Tax=Fischerella thermalis CCMEE 5318 TaxID=2019666 RepID=A0A2N6LF92_9CYAN|nr:glycosyltransferase family 4 protein [Fischerella thermalis]PMB22291.1 glycosyltransferase [Fischerella thermalis CCMEE 5318]